MDLPWGQVEGDIVERNCSAERFLNSLHPYRHIAVHGGTYCLWRVHAAS